MQLPRASDLLVRRLAVASVVANVGIVVTGGVVRLTGSGLGCPTWPTCTADSLIPTPEYAQHGAIEFTNRMLTFVLAAVAVATLLAVLRSDRRDLTRLAVAAFLGIPAQAVLGGITVLTGLNPWTVAAHFLLSMVILAITTTMASRAYQPPGPARVIVNPSLVTLIRVLVGVTAAVLVLGTVVTGSGPHAGDVDVPRTGFDPETVSQLHADAVMLLVGLTVATLLWLRGSKAPPAATRAAAVLLVVELAQGVIGFVQYFTGLPVILVGVHLLGASLVWIAALRLLLATSTREPAAAPEPVTDGHRGVRGGLRPRCGTIGACPTPSRFPPGRSPPPRPRRPRSSATASTSSPRASARASRADLFWPWFAANISVLGVATAPSSLGFGVSFWQGAIAGVVGIVVSFALCGCGRAGRQARLGADHGAVAGPRSACAATGCPRRCPGCSPSAGRPCWSSWPRWPPRPCSTGSAGAAATAPRSSR